MSQQTQSPMPMALFAASLALFCTACPNDSDNNACVTGTADCQCYANQTCNSGLDCVDDTCIVSTTNPDSGPTDSSPTPDTEPSPDASGDSDSDTCTCSAQTACCDGCHPKRQHLDCDSDDHQSASICHSGSCRMYASPSLFKRDGFLYDVAVTDDGSRWATLPGVNIHRSSDDSLVNKLEPDGAPDRREIAFLGPDNVAISRNDSSGPYVCANNMYPDGDYATIEIYSVSTGTKIQSWSYRCRVLHLSGTTNARLAGIPCLDMNQDETCIDERVMVWNANTGGVIRDLGTIDGFMHDVALSSGGNYVAAGGCLTDDRDPTVSCRRGVARVWDVGSGQLVFEKILEDSGDGLFDGAVESVAFSPDDEQFGYTSYDMQMTPRGATELRPAIDLISTQSWSRTTRIWTTPDNIDDWGSVPEQIHLFEQSFAATGRGDRLRLWDLTHESLIAQLKSRRIYKIWDFSDDGSLLLTGHDQSLDLRTAALWRFDTLSRPDN